MSVKVSKIKNIEPSPKSYLSFDWECIKCGSTVHDQVVENTLLQYKTRSLGNMRVERNCAGCKTKHSMELHL